MKKGMELLPGASIVSLGGSAAPSSAHLLHQDGAGLGAGARSHLPLSLPGWPQLCESAWCRRS